MKNESSNCNTCILTTITSHCTMYIDQKCNIFANSTLIKLFNIFLNFFEIFHIFAKSFRNLSCHMSNIHETMFTTLLTTQMEYIAWQPHFIR